MRTVIVLAVLAVAARLAVGQWAEIDQFSAPPETDEGFGIAVDIDGEVIVIGDWTSDVGGENAGAAFVYRLDGCSWRLEQNLLPSDPQVGAAFGLAVAVSDNRILIGSQHADFAGESSGVVYVFEYAGGRWQQSARLSPDDAQAFDVFGNAVSLSGNIAVVGAVGRDAMGRDSGAVFVFEHGAMGWQQSASLVPVDGVAGDNFGAAVAVDGATVVVGAPFASGSERGQGAAYVASQTTTGWVIGQKLVATDGRANDQFGVTLDVAGDLIVCGAPFWFDGVITTGAAYAFQRDGDDWMERARLTTRDGGESTRLGYSVAIGDGDVLVGSPLYDGLQRDSGAVLAFSTDTWEPIPPRFASDGEPDQQYGYSVAASGTTAIVGAINAGDIGRGYLLMAECPVDLDGDGGTDLFDFLAFQSAFAIGDPVADFDDDGELTVFDFLCFQNAFAAGCR